MNKCLCCNKETKNEKFCSRSCSAQITNKTKPKRQKEQRTCCKCGQIHFLNRMNSLCEECLKKYKNISEEIGKLTLSDMYNRLSTKNKHPSWRSAEIRNLNRSWNKHLLLSPCSNCGYNKHVELCHIKPITSFSEDTKLSEVNAESNNIVLCRNCHWEFDNNLLDIKNL